MTTITESLERPIPRVGGSAEFLSTLLSERERFFTEVADGIDLARKLRYALLTMILSAAFYGAAAGSYAGALQALSAAIKLPLLFLATLAICFPAFYVVQVLVGSRLRLTQVLTLVCGALALTAILLAAVVPVTVFFLVTGANYYFLELMHVTIVLCAGLVGMFALHEGLSVVCEKRGVYPRKAMTIMRAWAVLFAFVGVQMAWNLRPFLGDRGRPFQVFREYEGNFYAAIIYSVQQLAEGEGRSAARERGAAPAAPRSLFDSEPPSSPSANPADRR
jgi:hypothetical protein